MYRIHLECVNGNVSRDIAMTKHKLTRPEKRITIFAGGYGSGKTEVAVNFSAYMAENGLLPLSIIDLDIVNPYFRSREVASPLISRGINVISPTGELCSADTPILRPEIWGAIGNKDMRVVLDVGGDDVGARVLSSMVDSFDPNDYEFLLVVNAKRPFTADVDSCLKMLSDIQTASRLKFTGLVSNTHLIDETDRAVVMEGFEMTREVSKRSKLPLKFISAFANVLEDIKPEEINCAVLPLSRFMLKPWEVKSEKG